MRNGAASPGVIVMIGRPLVSDMVETSPQVREFHHVGAGVLEALRYLPAQRHQILPGELAGRGGVGRLVDRDASRRLKIPIGLPKPSPAKTACEICARNARSALLNSHPSIVVLSRYRRSRLPHEAKSRCA